MKKEYMKPEQRVVVLQHSTQLLNNSVRGLSNNAGLNENIGSGNGDARARQYNGGWDDDWED